jgi:uncharacterized protein YodC (DUF2158 family)
MTNVTAIQSQNQIVPGAIVFLKSGGPDMTVRMIGGDMVICTWFNGGGSLEEARFSTREIEVRK